jgi:hypothetical protein
MMPGDPQPDRDRDGEVDGDDGKIQRVQGALRGSGPRELPGAVNGEP